MSRSTSRRRAAGIGVGALAAVVLAAPSALAQTETVELEPVAGSEVLPVVTALPAGLDEADPEDLDLDDLLVVSVPASGDVSVALAAGLSAAEGEVTAALVDVDAYETSLEEGSELPAALEGFDDLEAGVVEGDVTSVDVTVPVDDEGLVDVDEVVLVLDGVVVDVLGTTTSVAVPLDLVPAGEEDPAQVVTSLTLAGEVEGPLELVAGESFEVTLPDPGLLTSAGITSLDELVVVLLSGEDFADLPVDDLSAAGAGGGAGAGALSALAEGDDGEEQLEEPLDGFPLVEPDGTTATVTLADDQVAGPGVIAFAVPFGDTGVVALGAEAEVAAAAVEPAPTPEPTATAAPVPTPTATTPPRRNPGLRSNTGVETAAVPGLSDGQLAGLGGGLLALGTVAGVAVVRTQRRSRA